MKHIASSKIINKFVVIMLKIVTEILELKTSCYMNQVIENDKIIIGKGERRIEEIN